MEHTINRDWFFLQIAPLFKYKVRPGAGTGLDALLDVWEHRYSDCDDRWLAYCLATAYHETAFTMQPIEEKGSEFYFKAMYDIEGRRPATATRLGNTKPGDGYLFRGRGYVQITGRINYRKASVLVGYDLEANPEYALLPDPAADLLFSGMRDGLFTGKKLSDYFNANKTDWRGARRIVNGTDKADSIAEYAQKFYAAISYTSA